MQFTTVTNSTAYFSLLPGQNHFLAFYEPAERLRWLDYVQLDQLRFCWVAMQELLTEHKIYNLSDGSLTGFARRDLKKNNSDSPFAIQSGGGREEDAAAGGDGDAGGKVIGRGGGNARRNQGNANNAIVAPKKEVLERKKEMQQKAFMKEELLQYCTTRWPHTPSAKSCLFTIEECAAAELPADVQQKLDLVGKFNQTNNKKRRGPTFYIATVELPLLAKKGSPPVRYKIQGGGKSGGGANTPDCGWFNNRKDAENAVAEVALLGIRNIK
ncbi:hypothetical protein STCU_05177 [Strigomonas culicis]|nr:hypothetical protein STCU_05177 [Strigomonas culicis]|eukprot:EPY28346.1 hypothetical protein STCU_05177 [Strigomonas culicis]